MEKDKVVIGVALQTSWWVGIRIEKFKSLSHKTMAINPFLAPLLMGLHGFENFEELADFLLGGHFSTGHATGFGKLIDEKILPFVFGTTKVDAKFRKEPPFNRPIFDEIDHLVYLGGNIPHLLSQKAGPWTIQLTMAVQLNRAFQKLIEARTKGEVNFAKIVVGTFYGTKESLTDKYDILRGISRGAAHDVVNLTSDVEVYAGREFWQWLNRGEKETQEWVMEGILKGIESGRKEYAPSRKLVESYKKSFSEKFSSQIKEDGSIDWYGILRKING